MDSEGKPTGTTAEKVILTGSDVEKASVGLDENNQYVVLLELKESGVTAFPKQPDAWPGQILRFPFGWMRK